MSVIGGQNPIVQDGLVYILDFGNERSYTSGSNTAQSLIYNPVTASFVNQVNVDYSGLAVAYSVRKVVPTYSGPCMEVQSGSVSQSIGFDSFGNLDTGSLLTFAGSGDVSVKTWYDQSGNNNNAIQITPSSQPLIVLAGSIITENGKAALRFTSPADMRWTEFNQNGNFYNVFVHKGTYQLNGATNLNNQARIRNGGLWLYDGLSFQSPVTSPSISNVYSLLTFEQISNTISFRANGQSYGSLTRTNGSNYLVEGFRFGADRMLGTTQEVLFFTSHQSINRTFVENNINNYYNIFTPPQPPVPTNTRGTLEFNTPAALSLNQSFPGFSYDQGNLTLIFTGETKTNSPLFTQADQISIVGTTSSIGYGSPTNNLGRTFPASGFDHVSLRFTTGSVDCFVNGIPTAPNSIFPTGSFGTGDFIASNYSGSLGNLLVYNRELSDDEIYAIYLQQARRYGLIEQDKPYTVDSSVYAYTQAAGITGSSVITALDAFVVGLKANNLWNKMIAIYPFLGSDTVKTRYNLKDPSLNTTAITYSGSWSASDSGSYNNNTSSYGILENIKGDYYHPLISSQSIHLSYLSYDTPVSGGYLMGTEELPGLPGDIAQPAAAYSVRKVRTAYTGSAMTVRRDFDDVTFDVGFDGNGNLDTGSLLTNMTASGLTTTLPGDYSGLAAAYSLRKVSSSYSGYAVEVRRSSDNYSASIGFDSFGNFDTASLDRFIATGSGVLAGSYSNLAAAYSLRKVVPGYSGFVIQIESASLTQDISFNPDGTLDTGSILSFAGSGDAFVRIWYDQSGNNNHMSQSSATFQPKIYSGSQGSIILENGKPALQFDGTDDTLVSSFSSTQPLTSLLVAKSLTNATATRFILGDSDVRLVYTNASSDFLAYAGGSTPSFGAFNTNQNLFFTYVSGSSSRLGFNGGTISSTTNLGSSALGSLSIGGGTAYVNGTYQEVIVYTTDQISNRTYIENNINSYYGIYTPDSVSTEDAFVKTWYDQSGNNRHATQSVDASQPQIVSSGVITVDGNRPAIRFDGTDDYFTFNNINTDVDYIGFQVVKKDTTNTLSIPVAGTTIGDSYLAWNYNDNSLSMRSARGQLSGATLSTTAKQLFISLNIQTGNNTIWANGSLVITGVPSTLGGTGVMNAIGRRTAGEYGLGTTQEIIIYQSNITSSRGLIEDNINGYYNIFTHSLDSGSGYVTRWYDQSGNDRHAVQTTNAKQPIIISSGSIITLFNKPTIRFSNGGLSIASSGYDLGTNNTLFFVHQIINSGVLMGSFYRYYRFNSNTTAVMGSGGTDIIVNENFRTGSLITSIQETGRIITAFKNGRDITITKGVRSTGGTWESIGSTRTDSQEFYSGTISEFILNNTVLSSSIRQPIEQNINSYFNIYYQPYNLNSNSLSLFSSPTTVVGAANNVASASFTTGGPLGLITVSRTGSSNYTLWKNRVPNKATTSPSVPQSTELYLNAANLNNSLFSASQNNIAYASVGAGLTDDEVYTYYELVDELQTELGRGVTDPNAFITTWDTRITGTGTVTGTSSIALPLYGTQAITASWGDGTVSLISQSAQIDKTHSYAEPGIYTVSITGQGQGFQFNNGGDRAKLMDIGQWGSISGSVGAVFFGCTNLVGTAADIHPVAGLTSYFRGTVKFNGAIGNWNTSDITDMLYTFGDATAFNQPIGSWNVGNVTRMTNTFLYASSFNQNIGNWDVSKVTEMARMFDHSPFNNGGSPDINNWRPISCSDFTSMFANCPFNQPIGNWPISASNITMNSMFRNADAFNQNLGSWDVSRVSNMGAMFQDNGIFNNSGSNLINNWRPISCSFFGSMFYNSPFNQPIGNWTIGTGSQIPATGINMQYMFSTSPFNQNIGAWNVEKVTAMNSMFQSAGAFNNSGSSDINNWRPISCSNFSSMFSSATAFNQPIENWTIGTGSQIPVTGISMASMFNNADAFNQNIGAWNVEKVTNMSGMFSLNGGFNNSGSSDINNWRPISCSNFSGMFFIATAFNQPIGNWPLSASNIDMGNMFRNCNFSQDIGSWDVSRVISFGSMFQQSGFNNSGSTNINNWQINTGSNVSFFQMFYQCPFNQPIGSWNVSKVTNMYSMFENNSAFNQSLENWTPISCSNFSRMFYNRIGFNGSVLNWTLPTTIAFTTDLMFSGGNTTSACKLNQDLSNWDVTKATNMSGMFGFNTSFNNSGSAGINSWTPVSCSNFSNMFLSASAFNQPVEGWALPMDRTYTMANMFARATSFNQPLGLWNIVSCSNMAGMLDNCGMGIGEYSSTLVGWATQPDPLIPRNITLGAAGRQYDTPGSASRAILTSSPYNWIITGDTYVP
jgi:surface protein